MSTQVACKSDQTYLFEELLPKGKSALQVGARGGGAAEMTARLKRHGYELLDVLEIWPPNVVWCKSTLRVREIVEGDVRLIESYPQLLPSYDAIIWWHGPEHVTRQEFEDLLTKLKTRCRIFVIGAPWGVWEQDDLRGNPFERHVHHWSPQELESLGFSVYTFQTGHRDGSDIHNVMLGILKNETHST